MPRPREFSTEDVLQKAMMLFWEQGYAATSLDEIVERTGLARSSIYQAFGSKRGLFDQALGHYYDVQISAMLSGLETGEQGLEAITGFFTMVAELVETPGVDGQLGCFMVNTNAELAWRDEAVRPAVEAYRKRLHAAFQRALENAERLGEIPTGNHSGRARLLAAVAMGTFVLGRGNPETRDTRLLSEALVDEVATWRAESGQVPREAASF